MIKASFRQEDIAITNMYVPIIRVSKSTRKKLTKIMEEINYTIIIDYNVTSSSIVSITRAKI